MSQDQGNVKMLSGGILAVGLVVLLGLGYFVYTRFRIEVPVKHYAVLTKKSGADILNHEEVSNSEQKGLQLNVLSEGRYFYNSFFWDWEVCPMIEIPEGKMGVRIRLYGEDLPYGHFLATKETEKGIVQDVLKPGRYAINALVFDNGNIVNQRTKNDYVEWIELHDPVTIPAGFKGVVTNLAGPTAPDPNVLLVEKGFRGVQKETLEPGTYYTNPYQYRIDAIDCRSQRFNLSESEDMGFPSKDGFWVSLDGIVEFRVHPEQAAEVYVMYNEMENDANGEHAINEEIVRKIIMPNARSFCRLKGSNSSGRDFIGGNTRTAFQTGFQKTIQETCGKQGVDIISALITRINPPQAIASPVRSREVNRQQLKQYTQQRLQADQDAKLAIEKALIDQKKKLVEAEREVVKLVTSARRDQEVALAGAERDKEVAIEELAAAKDKAAAILLEKQAEADVLNFENIADSSGWKKAISALGNDGNAYARYIMYQKLAPGYRSIMTNTSEDNPLMRIFGSFETKTTSNKK